MDPEPRRTKFSQNIKPEDIIYEKIQGEETVIKYLKGNFLGKGGFAKCYAVKNLETKETWAAKVMNKARLTKDRMK